jgi:DNA-binding protein YbaB
LNTVLIDENSPDGSISVCLTANREIKSIEIADDLLKDKDQLEDFLIVTLNKAIKKATDVNEAELAAVAKEGMPNIPGMDSFLK